MGMAMTNEDANYAKLFPVLFSVGLLSSVQVIIIRGLSGGSQGVGTAPSGRLAFLNVFIIIYVNF